MASIQDLLTQYGAETDAQRGVYDQEVANIRNAGTGGPDLALLGLAAGLLSPTRTGSFGESVGGGLRGMMGPLAQMRTQDMDKAQKIAALRIAQSKLRGDYLTEAMKMGLAQQRVDAYRRVGGGRPRDPALQIQYLTNYKSNLPADHPDHPRIEATIRKLMSQIAGGGAGVAAESPDTLLDDVEEDAPAPTARRQVPIPPTRAADGPGAVAPPVAEEVAPLGDPGGTGAEAFTGTQPAPPAEKPKAAFDVRRKPGVTREWEPDPSDPEGGRVVERPTHKPSQRKDVAPAPGAKKGPDGSWYIKKSDGWYRWDG